jgi:hypothetical protein
MPRRSSLTVPIAEYSSTHRRSRSADDPSNVSVRTPAVTARTKMFEPGTSWGHPIALCSDDDEDNHNTTTITQTPRTTKAQDGASHPRPSSAKRLHLQSPTTPSRAQLELDTKPATDPGPRRQTNQDEIYERQVAYRHLDQLPCGRKQYADPMGPYSRTHQGGCTQCIEHEGEHHESYEDETQQLTDGKDVPTAQNGITTKHHGDHDDDNDSDKAASSAGKGGGNEKKQEAVGKNYDQMAPMVNHRLIQAAKKKLSGDEKPGYLYILYDPEKPDLLKVGRSVQVENRGKQHRLACGLVTKWVKISNCMPNMKRAEKLALIDMDHLKTKWICSKCSREHQEWFQISEEKAKAVVAKWVTWINKQAPYNAEGNLEPIWGWLIEYRRVPRTAFEDDDHEARWAHWNKVLSRPSSAAKIKFKELQAAIPQQYKDANALAHRQLTSHGPHDNILTYGNTIFEQAMRKGLAGEWECNRRITIIEEVRYHSDSRKSGSMLSSS